MVKKERTSICGECFLLVPGLGEFTPSLVEYFGAGGDHGEVMLVVVVRDLIS